MELMDDVKVLDNLRHKYEGLSASEKKIADYILHNPENAVNCNVSELANASGTSDATIIRFCKHAGYSGYYQLRLVLSRELGRMGDNKEKDSDTDTVTGILNLYASNIASLARNLSEDIVHRCAQLLENCHCVHIVAAGNTTPLANYMGFRFGRLGIRSTYHELPEYYLNDLVLADKEDLVLAISQSGTSKQVMKAMELARERKIKTIAIVGYKRSPVSELADYLLPAVVPERFFDYAKTHAHLYEMAVIDLLFAQIMNDRKKQNIDVNMMLQEMLISDLKM